MAVNGHSTHSLHRVGVEPHAVLAAYCADFLDGLDGADLVVCKHDGHKRCVRPDGGFHIGGGDKALRVYGQVSHLKAFAFQRLFG